VIGLKQWVPVAAAAGVLLACATGRAELGVPISAVQALNSDATVDTSADYYANVAADGAGHWVAVWHSQRNDFDIAVARSVDGGEHWSNPLPLNNNAATDTGSDMFPDVCTDRKGNWVAVWQSTNPLSGEMTTDYDIHVARSIDNGANWSNPIALNTNAATDAGSDGSPRIATDGLGHWVAVWGSDDTLGGTINSDFDILVARSVDNGASWSAPKPLNTNAATDTGFDHGAVVSTDGQGHWVCAWHSDDTLGGTIDSDYDILVARSVDNGENWSNPVPLNTNAATDVAADLFPSITNDGLGHWLVAWQSARAGTDGEALIARSVDNGANWSVPIPLNTNEANDVASDRQPVVATDGLGNWAAVWEARRNLGGGMQERKILLARSINNGADWSSPSTLDGDIGDDFDSDGSLSLTTDRFGQWVLTCNGSGALGDMLGTDFDVLTAHFALPDCNQNLIADSTETLLGLLPDINNNNIPDICEVIEGPPPSQTGCGGGICGAGTAMLMPLSLLGLAQAVRRARARRK